MLAIALLGCAPAPGHASEPDPAELLSADALFDATFAMTSIGPRMVATGGEDEAAALVRRMFEDAGFTEIEDLPFVWDAWRPGTASIYAGGANGREIPVQALSPSPDAEVTVPLKSSDEDFAGSAVLISSDEGSRAEAFVTATFGQAAALVRVTDEVDDDGAPLVEVGHTLDGSTLPAIAVDHGTGDWLRSHLDEDVTIKVHPDVAVGHTSHDLAVRVPGTTVGKGRVYVVAHDDSWYVSECAFDNALGAAALARLAERARRSPPPDREIVFLATSGEEQGLQGAIAWVNAHEDEVGPADTVIVLDVAWSAQGTYVSLGTDEGIRLLGIDDAAAEDLVAEDGLDAGIGSDHLPFVTRGARSLWMGRWPDKHYHTTADTLDQLDFDEVEQAIATQWDALVELAGIPQ